MTTATYTLPTGLSIFAKRSDSTYRCDDCSAWADAGDSIRHSKRCDTETLQAVLEVPAAPTTTRQAPLAEIRKHARNGEVGRFSEDEIERAHSLGHITTSDAMNRDF